MGEANGASKYRSDFTNAQLYELVKEAAFKLRPERPEKLSTRVFDAGRANLSEPHAPQAHWIAKRLGRSWPDLVKVACDRTRDFTMTDSAARRAPAEKWLDQRHLHFAVRYVAKARGQESFTAHDYDATRVEVLAATGNGSGGGPLPTILPSAGQLIQIVRRIEKAEAEKQAADKKAAEAEAAAASAEADGDKKPSGKKKSKAPKKTREVLPELDESEAGVDDLEDEVVTGYWNKVLGLAGLKPYEMSKKKGLAFVEAIHYYIEATGLLPTSEQEVKRFATAASFSVEHGGPIKPYLPAVATYRASLGLPMIGELRKRGEFPDFDLSKVPLGLPKPVPQPGDWSTNEEGVIDALCEYLDTVAARGVKQPTRGDYLNQQKGRRGEWPSASTLGRTGPCSFPEWIDKARPVWKARKKKAA